MSATWWRQIDELDEDQRQVISIPLGQSHLVLGPPGSGKTNLLLLRAKYLSLSDRPNILVIVYTRVLKEFLLSGASGYGGISDALRTHAAWQAEFLRSYSITPAEEGNFIAERRKRNAQIAEVIAKNRIGKMFDTILLDEAQDYWPEELDYFNTLGGHLFAVGDSKQKIYDGEDVIDRLKVTCKQHTVLKYHYRNCPEVCRLADCVAKSANPDDNLETACNYKLAQGKGSVSVKIWPDYDSMAAATAQSLREQMVAYPGEMLGVLCYKRETVLALWDRIARTDLAPVSCLQMSNDKQSYGAFEPNHRICFCTISGAKGLEFRALHLAGLEDLTGPLQRNLAYTAITRAKTSLTIHHVRPLPRFLQSALSQFGEPKTLPSVKSLFQK